MDLMKHIHAHLLGRAFVRSTSSHLGFAVVGLMMGAGVIISAPTVAVAQYKAAPGTAPKKSQNPTDSAWSCATSDQAVRTIRLCTPKILDPKTSEKRRIRYLMKRAKAWVIEDELWAAINDYDQVIGIDPKNRTAMVEQSTLYSELDEHTMAVKGFTRLIKTDPQDIVALCKRGSSRLQLKEHPQALDDYNKALEHAPDNVKCLVGRGDVYEDLGEQEKAFAEYTAAIAVNERYWHAYYRRAELHKKRGHSERAIADYSRVLQLNSVNMYVRHQLRDLGVREPYP